MRVKLSLKFLLAISTIITCSAQFTINNPSFENNVITNVSYICPQDWSCSGTYGLSTSTGIELPFYDDRVPDGSTFLFLQNVGSGFSQVVNANSNSGFVAIKFAYAISRSEPLINPFPFFSFDITGCGTEVNKRYLQPDDQWSEACMIVELCPTQMILSALIVNVSPSYVVFDQFQIIPYNTTIDPTFSCYKMNQYPGHLFYIQNINDFSGNNIGMTSWIEAWVGYTIECYYPIISYLGQLIYLQGSSSNINLPVINSAVNNYSITAQYLTPCSSSTTDLTQCVGSISFYSVSGSTYCLINQIPVNIAFGYQRNCNCSAPFFTISTYTTNSFNNLCSGNQITNVMISYNVGPNPDCVLFLKSFNLEST